MKNGESWNWLQSIAAGLCFGGLVAALLYGPNSDHGWTGLVVFLMAAWCFVGAKILGDLRFEAVFTLICGPTRGLQRRSTRHQPRRLRPESRDAVFAGAGLDLARRRQPADTETPLAWHRHGAVSPLSPSKQRRFREPQEDHQTSTTRGKTPTIVIPGEADSACPIPVGCTSPFEACRG